MNTKQDMAKTIDGESDKSLAEIWCWLNCATYLELDSTIQTMDFIEARIGHKACNQEWNKDRMTDEEHEKWYGHTYTQHKGEVK